MMLRLQFNNRVALSSCNRHLYQQMFGRDAETGGLDFWVGLLANGSQTLGQVAETIASLASEIDLQVLTGRVVLADAFTSNLATNADALANFNTVTGLEIGRGYLNQVKGTTVDNVSAYVAKAAETVATLPPSTGGGNPAPTPPTITFSADNGVSATDHITNVDVQTVSGTYAGESADGNQVQVKVGDGTWATAIIEGGTWSVSDVTLNNGRGTLAVQTVDSEGHYIAGTRYSYSYTLDTDKPTGVSIGYKSAGKVSVTSDVAGSAGLYDDDSTLIAGTTTKLSENVERTLAITALSDLTVATVKIQDVAGNFADDSKVIAIGTNNADTFSAAQDFSAARYGFDGDDNFEFTNSIAMLEVRVEGGSGNDTVTFTTGFETFSEGNLNSDVANLTGVENLQLFGASSVNVGIEVEAAGVSTILTGDDDTTVRYDSSATLRMTVDGTALATGKTLTLTMNEETANFIVTNLHGNLIATELGNNDIQVTAIGNAGVTITTGSANDTVIGSAGNDIINAGNGTNSITGGQGVDTLTGGSGADTFNFVRGDAEGYVFTADGGTNDSFFLGTAGTDVITNFTSGSDKLTIAGVSSLAGYVPADTEVIPGVASFVLGSYNATSHVFSVDSGGLSTLVIFNSDASGESIVLTGVNNLSATDFNGLNMVA